MHMDKEARDYFAEASRWDLDRAALIGASARRAWWVAIAAAALAAISGVALATLVPLKRVDPFVIRVESGTGIVDVVPTYAGTADLPETVTRHLVTQYVVQRERYIPAIAESDYEQIGAYHSAAMNQQWVAAWSRTNPDSPLNRYADATHVRVQVQAVSFLRQGRGAAEVLQVRFLTGSQKSIGAGEELAHFVATLQVAYGPPSTDVRLRALNPLGFKVLEYRREPEISGPAGERMAAAAANGGAAP
jgi:type IV secretion system protein VirB8